MDDMRKVLKVGKASHCAGPPQPVCDKIEVFLTAGDAGINAFSGRMQLLDPLGVTPIQ